jgi:hypothetical protein
MSRPLDAEKGDVVEPEVRPLDAPIVNPEKLDRDHRAEVGPILYSAYLCLHSQYDHAAGFLADLASRPDAAEIMAPWTAEEEKAVKRKVIWFRAKYCGGSRSDNVGGRGLTYCRST